MLDTTMQILVPMQAGGDGGASIKDWVLAIAGNVFIILFVIRALGDYARKDYGGLLSNVAVAAIIACFVYLTDGTINVLKTLARMILGIG